MTVHDLPPIEAVLNGTSAVLLVTAFLCIKRRLIRAHGTLMVTAFATSTAFLTLYLIYHYYVGEISSNLPRSLLRTGYFAMLFTHTLLAIVMVPMILITLWRAWRRDWPRHRRIAVWTFPIWLYVSVTGVIIYVMLYHVFPALKH